jgi:hypothetical protein
VLVYALGGWRSGPIRLGEFEAPKVRARREKLDAYAGAFIRSVTKVDDTALLLFFRDWVDQDKLPPKFKRLLEIKQTPVRIHHNGMAGFTEFAAVAGFSLCPHRDPRKYPGAATLSARLSFCRRGHKPIVHCEKG